MKRLLDIIKNKYLQQILKSKNKEKILKKIEKKICKQFDDEDKNKYFKYNKGI